MARKKVSPEDRQKAFDAVGNICVHCLSQPATEAHHNPPRGASKRLRMELVPLCGECHVWAHEHTKASVPTLFEELDRAMQAHKENQHGDQESIQSFQKENPDRFIYRQRLRALGGR